MDGDQTIAFNAEMVFQDIYLLGRESKEYKGKVATELTSQVLMLLANHQKLGVISRSDIHQVISDVLYLSGFIRSAEQVETRRLTA